MIAICKICGKEIALESEPAIGQHVLCPYCNNKFSYVRLKPRMRLKTRPLAYTFAMPKVAKVKSLRRVISIILVAAVIALIAVFISLLVSLGIARDKITAAEQRNVQLTEDNTGLKKEIARLTKKEAELERDVSELLCDNSRQRIEQLQAELEQLREENQQLRISQNIDVSLDSSPMYVPQIKLSPSQEESVKVKTLFPPSRKNSSVRLRHSD